MSDDAGIKTRRMTQGERPAFTRDDASFLLEFPVLFVTAALVPEQRWQRVAYRLEQPKSALARFSPEKIRRELKLIRGRDAPSRTLQIAATRASIISRSSATISSIGRRRSS